MRNIGFSTGALAKGDFHNALKMLAVFRLACVELSALRMSEVPPLVNALNELQLNDYQYVSFHAPSSFQESDERALADLLFERIPETWPIILHPDSIHDYRQWRRFGKRLAIENMDRRKHCGRNTEELIDIFQELPEASLCFDIGHVRQYDPSMTEAFLLLCKFSHKLVQVHMSEVNSESQHDPISYGAKLAFRQVADLLPPHVPIILESRVAGMHILSEISAAADALRAVAKHRSEAAHPEWMSYRESVVATL